MNEFFFFSFFDKMKKILLIFKNQCILVPGFYHYLFVLQCYIIVIFNKEGRREGNEYSCHGWRKFKDADDQQQSPVYVLGPSWFIIFICLRKRCQNWTFQSSQTQWAALEGGPIFHKGAGHLLQANSLICIPICTYLLYLRS